MRYKNVFIFLCLPNLSTTLCRQIWQSLNIGVIYADWESREQTFAMISPVIIFAPVSVYSTNGLDKLDIYV